MSLCECFYHALSLLKKRLTFFCSFPYLFHDGWHLLARKRIFVENYGVCLVHGLHQHIPHLRGVHVERTAKSAFKGLVCVKKIEPRLQQPLDLVQAATTKPMQITVVTAIAARLVMLIDVLSRLMVTFVIKHMKHQDKSNDHHRLRSKHDHQRVTYALALD